MIVVSDTSPLYYLVLSDGFERMPQLDFNKRALKL